VAEHDISLSALSGHSGIPGDGTRGVAGRSKPIDRVDHSPILQCQKCLLARTTNLPKEKALAVTRPSSNLLHLK